MRAKSKAYLRQFDQDNIQDNPITKQNVMNWFNNSVVRLDFQDLVKIKEFFHAQYGNFQFKVFIIDIQTQGLIDQIEFKQSLHVWTSYDNEIPYRKTLSLGIKLGIIFEDSNILYLINMATNEELEYHFPFNFSSPCNYSYLINFLANLFISDQYVFIVKGKSVLWLYDILENPLHFQFEKLNIFKSQIALDDTNPFNDPLMSQFAYENVSQVTFTPEPQKKIKFKIIQTEGQVLKIGSDAGNAIMIQNLTEKQDNASTTFTEDENLSSSQLTTPLAKSTNITQQLSNMFKTMTLKKSLDKKTATEELQETLNVVDIDLRQVRETDGQNIQLDQVSVIYKYFNIAAFKKIEVILIEESDNQKRLYVLQSKASKGFRMLEIEREVITPLIDSDCEVLDWHFDLDTHRLTLKYQSKDNNDCVKVLPLKSINKNAQSNYGGSHSLNKYMQLIQKSQMTFEDEVFSSLSGKVYPIQSYINYDNFIIIGHGSIFSFKNLSNVCSEDKSWEHRVRIYQNVKNDTPHYCSCEVFNEDIHYFYMSQNKLFVKYNDHRKTFYTVKNGLILQKDLYYQPPNFSSLNIGNVVRARELLIIKEKPHFLFDTIDETTGERFLRCNKPDFANNMANLVFSLKIEDQNNFSIFLNRKNATIAAIYKDYLTLHKLVGGKSDAIMTINFNGALQDLDLNAIEFYTMSEKYIYILSKDVLYIINLLEQRVEAPQIIGQNVRHFLIFDDKFIYWLEKHEVQSIVKFDYFNPEQQIKLIDCQLFAGAHQLNSSFIVPLKKNIEITHIEDNHLYLLNDKNQVKVWELNSGKMVCNNNNLGKDYSSYHSKWFLQYILVIQRIKDIYVLKKPCKDNTETMVEYVSIKISIKDNGDTFVTDEIRKIIFVHNKCSEIRGTTEKIKFSNNQKRFLAWSANQENNIFIIYKFLDQLDERGYHMYYAVSIINHPQLILFSPNFTKFLEFDQEERAFKIQVIDLEKCRYLTNAQKDKLKENYSYSDYFQILTPNLRRSRQSLNTNNDTDFLKSSLIEQQIQEEESDSTINYSMISSPEQMIKLILHKNTNWVKIDIPLQRLQNKFNFMKMCPLAGNDQWPFIFCCDNSIAIIMDNFIVKKYAICLRKCQLEEISTIVDWSARKSKPYFTGAPPKLYENFGTILSKHSVFNLTSIEESESSINDLYHKYRQENIPQLPVNFDLNQLQSIEFCNSMYAAIGEYEFREDRRYVKRKRIVFNFTFFHWYLVAKLREIYRTVEIPQKVLKEACLAVFPEQRNILFYLIDDYNLLTYVYTRMQINFEDYGMKYPLYIPLIKDVQGKTALHYCLQNGKITDQFLNYLADYPLNYYSENLKELVPFLIIKGLQKINYFLDKRFKQTPFLQQFDRERIKFCNHYKFAFTGKDTFWFQNRSEIESDPQLFDENEFQLPTKILVLDLPNIVNQSSLDTVNIFTALRTTEQMDIFESEAVRAIIEYSWPITRQAIIKWMMIPSIVFLGFFILYTTFVFPISENCRDNRSNYELIEQGNYESEAAICEYSKVINQSSKIAIIIFLVYFLMIEIIQSYKDMRIYLSSPWNYLDLIAILFVSFTVLIDYLDIWVTSQRPLFAFATLIIWLKSLYYLRIFREVGYLTSMIIQVIQDMVYFFVILIMSIFAFGNSFYVLSQAYPNKEDRFIQSYPEGLTFTFRLLLGDFETSHFGDEHLVLVWILFSLASIFLIVVLLNLLISIISESYSNIQLNAKNSMYKELASLIYDNYFLTDYERQTQKYIVVAKPDNEYIEDIVEERAIVANQSDKDQETLSNALVKKNLESIVDRVNSLSNDVSEIKQLLLAQQEMLLKQNRTKGEEEFQEPDFDVQRLTTRVNRQSFGLAESFNSSIRKRRPTNLSQRNKRNNELNISQGEEQKERKQTLIRKKNLDIFQ